MDASLNITEAPNRTEPKQPTAGGSKQGREASFASVLSGNQNKETSNSTPQNSQDDKATQTNSNGEAAANSTEGAETVLTTTNGQPATAEEKNSQSPMLLGGLAATTPSVEGAVNSAKSATASSQGGSSQINSAIGGAAAFTNAPQAGFLSPTGQTLTSDQAQNANPQSVHGSMAQTQASVNAGPVVSEAQNGDKRIEQNKDGNTSASGVPKTERSSTGESKLFGLAKALSQTPSAANAQGLRADTAASAIAPSPAAQVTPDANLSQQSVSADDTLALPSALAGSVASSAKRPDQSKPQIAANAAAQTSSVSSTPQPGQTANVTPANNAGAQLAASTTPFVTGTPEAAAAQQAGQPTVNANTERPANAAIEGLNPQTGATATKDGKTVGTQSNQTPGGQNQNTSMPANSGAQHISADASTPPIRSDLPFETSMTMDVDGAPELLTTAGLQERVHNNLPQTMLHLRLAPGQAPVIAPNDLALHIARQVQDGTTRFEIRIDPPEMGRIEVQMDMRSQKPVQAHLFVERAETLDLLQRDARQLERALQNLGIDVDSDSLSFSLRDGNTDTAGQNSDQNGALHTAYQVDEKDSGSDIVIPADLPAEAYGFRLAASQGINIQV